MAKTLEEEFDEIEAIIANMEEENVPLEKSFELYEKGMKKLLEAEKKINTVEKKIQELTEDGMQDIAEQ